jgi:hypothetical protein
LAPPDEAALDSAVNRVLPPDLRLSLGAHSGIAADPTARRFAYAFLRDLDVGCAAGWELWLQHHPTVSRAERGLGPLWSLADGVLRTGRSLARGAGRIVTLGRRALGEAIRAIGSGAADAGQVLARVWDLASPL